MKKAVPAANPDAYLPARTGWRGKSLRDMDGRLKPGGRYEMATIELREGDSVSPAVVRQLTREAVALNAALGDPTEVVRSGGKTSAA